jgi:serine protease Do
MLEWPQSRAGESDAGELKRGGARRSGAKALLAAGLLAAASAPMVIPAFAQLKPDAPSVETPFGRAPITFADIIAKVKPSVVSISVVGGKKNAMGPGGQPFQMPDLPDDLPPQLKEFFKNFKGMPGQGGPQQQRPTQAQGSGFVISNDGYVVTNNHVIDGASKIQVSFDDQEKIDADLVGTDPRTDLALLKIKGSKTDYPHVNFAKGEPRVGDWALAVGNPFGLGGTVTAGIVSALARDIGSGPYDYMQIDAAVNRGNSGGPTFNLEGEVVGINTAIFSPSGGNVGIAFAVPARTATSVIEALKTKGTVARGWLGVKIQNMDEDAASSLGLTDAKGALVGEVLPNSPAGAAGIKRQDVIVSVNGEKIGNSRELSLKIAELDPNTSVDVKFWRNGKEDSLKVKLGTFPKSEDEVANLKPGDQDETPAGNKEIELLGLKLSSERGGASDGVAIAEVDDDSNAAQKGLKPGDVILEVNGEAVSSPTQVQDLVKKVKEQGRTAVMLYIQSGEQKVQLAVPFTKKG